MNTTQLSVNPEKLINNLRFSFTQSTTVLGELMQNARRAGATFMESAKEADEWDFHNFVVANTADKPADALQRLLPTFNSCPALFSRTFQIVLGNDGDVVTVAEM